MNNLVFFLDFDNTLLDNDLIKKEIDRGLVDLLGEREARDFWSHHDTFRDIYSIVDFPNTVRKYCYGKEGECESNLKKMFKSLDFPKGKFPHVEEVLHHLRQLGVITIFSEGDSVYQVMKIEQSGIRDLVDEMYVFHDKLAHIAEMRRKYWGKQLVFIDDKADKLARMKKQFPEIVTIHVRQGHYGEQELAPHQYPDLSVDTIGQLIKFNENDFKHRE